MSYAAPMARMLAELSKKAPALANHLVYLHRRCERGLLSVGLKIHCLNDTGAFSHLFGCLGSHFDVLGKNMYQKSNAAWCFVLPPVGSAEAAIRLIECLEQYSGEAIFNNTNYQLQVCSPGRLDNKRTALLVISFYLGSDTLRQYAMGELDTTVKSDATYDRGDRLAIYDASGDFDPCFKWWKRISGEPDVLFIKDTLLFDAERTDVLVGTASPDDIRNVNFAASMLAYAQFKDHDGWWHRIGLGFEQDLMQVLGACHLSGIVDAQWVTPTEKSIIMQYDRGLHSKKDDVKFRLALSELVSTALDENHRLKEHKAWYQRLMVQPRPPDPGIFAKIDEVFAKYRKSVFETTEGTQS